MNTDTDCEYCVLVTCESEILDKHCGRGSKIASLYKNKQYSSIEEATYESKFIKI